MSIERRPRWPRAVVVALAGFAAGHLTDPAGVRADVRQGPERQAFLSGGERSELILKEVSDTLKRIDGRLERIQSIAEGKAGGNGRPDARGR